MINLPNKMIEVNNKTRTKIDIKLVKKVASEFLRKYSLSPDKTEVSIALVGDQGIKKLNRRYLSKNQTTDVLAFNGENNYLGEVIINLAQIKRQAKEYGNSFKKELVYILVHGLLHLAGYDDETKKGKEEMAGLAENLVDKLKV